MTTRHSVDLSANRTVGLVLREMREDAGLSAYDVEARTGLKVTRITSWERGERTPSLERVEQLCGEYGVPLAWCLSAVENRLAIDRQDA